MQKVEKIQKLIDGVFESLGLELDWQANELKNDIGKWLEEQAESAPQTEEQTQPEEQAESVPQTPKEV